MTGQPEPSTPALSDALESLRHAAERLISLWPPPTAYEALSMADRDQLDLTRRDIAEVLRRMGPPLALKHPRARTTSSDDPAAKMPGARFSSDAEGDAGVSLQDLTYLNILDAIKGFGPQKFKQVHEAGVPFAQLLHNPDALTLPGKTGDQLRSGLRQVAPSDWKLAEERAAKQIQMALKNRAQILTYPHPHYPSNIYASNNPIPILYARGDLAVLQSQKAVACVGSRNIRDPYDQLQHDFCADAARQGWIVVSGFALGADTVAHRAAIESGGATLAVMPSGLDRPFPPENHGLWTECLTRPGVVFISEFPFGTGASSMNLRKRNKTIVAAARGVLVGQSAKDGGAMNAYKFAREQHKPVATFAADGSAATTGNVAIGQEERIPTAVFPIGSGSGEWKTWLATL